MRHHLSLICLLSLLTLTFSGCQQQEQPEAAPKAAAPAPMKQLPLLLQPIEPVLVELPGEAVSTWRQSRAAKPALLLLSADPFLRPVPEALATEIRQLVDSGSTEAWRQKATPQVADPLLLPQMTVTAALEADLFSELIWVLPAKEDTNLSAEVLQQQLTGYGAFAGEEQAQIELVDGVFHGTARDLPFRAVPLAQLPTLDGPLVVHIDVSYFQPLYKGEIKTPLFPLIHGTLVALRDKQLKAEAVTVSRSNLDGTLPLEVRFVGDAIADMIRTPALLERAVQANWKRRAEALYLSNFFQKEKIRELHLAMEQDAPEDASVKFDLYQTARQFKEGDRALEYLRQAVALDPVYGLEYMNLAPMAVEKGRPDEALRMVDLAMQAFPEFPFIRMEKARYLIDLKEYRRARGIIDDLQTLEHSAVYYPRLPEILTEMKKATQKGGPKENAKE